MNLITTSSAVTMTSREIAELTGKQHKNVLADISKMLGELGISSADFSAQYKDSTGRTLPCFNLPKRETLILISGYDTALRARVVDRMNALEQQNGPRSPAELILAMAQQMVANEQRITGLDDRLAKVEQKQIVAQKYQTVLEFAIGFGLDTDKSTLMAMGKKAAVLSRQMGHEITTKHQDHKGFRGNVNAYHPDVLFALLQAEEA